ncbi:MAG: amino acid adenylation domain-containing protein, partial [bacterium]|nr:amino acid adenylation domain-containing protein [bacterium]
MTYRELNRRSDNLALLLIQKGLQAGSIVALMADRSVETVAAIFGILKAGGIYLPVEPDYPGERIDFMLKDSGAEILIGEITNYKLQTISLDEGFNSKASNEPPILSSSHPPILHPSSPTQPTQLSYIIYTSGSTGKPKGVMVEHASAVNLAFAQGRRFRIDETDRILQFYSISFDVSVEEIVIAFSNGAALVLIDRETLLDSTASRDYIRLHSITHIDAVPSFLNNLDMDGLSSVKRIVSGGDTCPVSLAKKCSALPGCEFFN